MLAVYGGCIEHPEVVCTNTAEELRRWLGGAFIAVVGDEELARELQAAYFTREELEEFVKYFHSQLEGVHV
ncbi:hypothetical protein [Pyrobaculum aerophilum]|uniref:Uncharacterized protein n=1 Tax=Pyrobaculum aerophilum TaxID=13773 RepID=A0A371QU42_9CREN|nr:hypothetical protein [Pyrobaculum aerophilum]RFA92375.1 hypothetical protein CGL51_14330 [Pyrobaculum aerophilum]RFB00149.1 hypothetical protein CGL52_02080 [Pyrobaculum aerophilum]